MSLLIVHTVILNSPFSPGPQAGLRSLGANHSLSRLPSRGGSHMVAIGGDPDPTEIRNVVSGLEQAIHVLDRTKANAVDKLENLATELDTKQRDMNIAKTAFASSGIVGTVLAVAGLIAAPFTFGASLGLTIAGGVVGGASGVGGLATAIAEGVINSNTLKEAEEAIADYKRAVAKFQDIIQQFYDMIPSGDTETFERAVNEQLDYVSNEEDFKKLLTIVRGFGLGCGIGKKAVSIGSTILGEVGATVAKSTASASLKMVKIGGVVLSLITVPLDLHTIVSNSIKIHKKTPSEVAENIREMARTVKKHCVLAN